MFPKAKQWQACSLCFENGILDVKLESSHGVAINLCVMEAWSIKLLGTSSNLHTTMKDTALGFTWIMFVILLRWTLVGDHPFLSPIV